MSRLPMTLHALGNPGGLRRTLVAYVLYGLVEIAAWLAIILYAFDEGGAPLAGVVAVVQLAPAVVLGPLLAGVGDRWSRGTALAASYLGVAITALATMVALLASAPVTVVVAASTTLTIALSVVRPIHFAALPPLARSPEDLVSANSLSSAGDGVAFLAGPVLAGIGVQAVGPWLVFAGSTVAAAVAAALCLRLGLGRPAAEEAAAEPGGWRSAVEGLRALWGDWAALALLLVLATRFVLGGALDLLGISYATEVLGLGQSGAGLLIGALGLGGLLGAAVAAAVSVRRTLTPTVVVGGLVQGVGVAVVAVLALLAPAMAALALAGLGSALLMVGGRTLLQRCTDDRVLARVFAVQEGTALIGVALGAAVAPPLIDRFSAAGAFVPFGVGIALLALAVVGLVRRLDARSVVLPEETALLRGVPFLAVLPAYELERLARNARWREVPAGTDVVRQGDKGEEFYVVAAGEFAVTVDGARRPTTLGPGAAFGEIALLEAVPRTATVTAVSPGRLLGLTAEDFLAAVTGSPDGHAVAAEVAAEHRARDRAAG
ncbi:MAG: cyclic nucleotide-binding domain-containing protein [Candidatus Nanopelagicales bacterium]